MPIASVSRPTERMADTAPTIRAEDTYRLSRSTHGTDTICNGLDEMVTRSGKTTRLLISG